MIALAIQYLIAAACLMFVISLFLGRSDLGRWLRRLAGALFLLAFLPSLLFGAISGGVTTPSQPEGAAEQLGCGIGSLLGLMILSFAAYVMLEIRKRLGRPSRDAWSEYINLRSTGKTAVRNQKPRRNDPSPLMDQIDDE